ncbi:MAG: triose-phosphate isomerase [Pseudomonadota bacterium]
MPVVSGAGERGLLIAGNWKMHGTREELSSYLATLADSPQWLQVASLFEDSAGAAAAPALCAALYLPATLVGPAAAAALPALMVGGQNLHAEPEGAFTGELSATHLLDAGARSVLVGHSERRQLFGETDPVIANKVAAAAAAGLRPVLCVGETLAEREAGSAEARVAEQLEACAQIFRDGVSIVVAYEPVWAIGTGKTASPEDAQAMHRFVRDWIRQRNADLAERIMLLYGGSMKPNNAADLLAQADIDGGLIGGASLKADSFAEILATAADVLH